MSLLNPLATALSQVFSSAARPNAEYTFSLLQNSYIGRLNDEIQKVNDHRGDVAREHELKRELKSLSTQIDSVQKYTFDNQSNAGKLEEAGTLVAELAAIFNSDGDATDVTAQEVTDFVAKRDEVIDKLNSLRVLSFPNIADNGRIRDLMDQAATLETYVPDVGAVDPEGTANPNNNRVIEDFLTTFANKVSVAATVTEDTVFLGSQMSLVATQKYFENEAELLNITQVEQLAKAQEIEDLKIQYANLLKAVSLSTESNLAYSDGLAKSLNGAGRPDAGSVLNLFT